MPQVDTHEIVVLGGGIAGLLLAGELAENHDVLLLEKSSRILRTKYWLTDRGSARSNEWLAPALDTTYSEMAFTASDGTTYMATGEYLLWDSDRLIDSLVARLGRHSARIALGERFISFKTESGGALVFANDRAIRCKLIIDCMGHASPIVYAKGVVDVLGYYLLYGATFPMSETLTPVALHNLMLSAQPGWIEAFPTSDGRLHIVLIVPTRTLTEKSDVRSDFQFITSKSTYAKHIAKGGDRRFLGGMVPVARMRRRALDRVFFFGEAGQVNPAASATALTRMLYSYRSVASKLSDRIRDGRLRSRDLAECAEPPGSVNERLQRALFQGILRWKSDDYIRVVEELIAIDDPALVNALIFGDMDEGWPQLSRWARKMMHARSKTLISALARSVLLPFN